MSGSKENLLNKFSRNAASLRPEKTSSKNGVSSMRSKLLQKYKKPSYGPSSSQDPGFLSRSLDTSWIDVEMMGHWLHLCDQEHGGQCQKPFGLDSATFGYPKLLIDVHKKCIVEAEPSHRYACLSYVWGNVPTLKTTQDNLLDLKKQKSLETRGAEIPRTIRDTINLIDQLGLRYLWVDSLCIIQDDARTKHDQIQSMAGIYANSYVTIIAGNGWDANHGLRGLQGITEPRQLSSFLKTDFQENLQPYSSIWYSRGWTFQEMVFSPRKIMFQYQLATWECNEKSWHESSLSKVSTPMDISRFHPKVTPWKSKVEFTE